MSIIPRDPAFKKCVDAVQAVIAEQDKEYAEYMAKNPGAGEISPDFLAAIYESKKRGRT